MEVFRVSDPVLQGVFWERLFIWKRQGKLAVLDWGGFQSRHDAMVRLLELTDDIYGLPELGPLTISTSDRPCSTDRGCISLGFSAADGYEDVAIPDFVFDSWPETGIADYAETTWEVADAGAAAPQQARCGWIGDPIQQERRHQLLEIAAARPDLIELDDGSQLTLPQQTGRWSSLIDVEGDGYSGRLKLLLHSGRPVLIHDRPWHEWYWGELEPMQNYIPVKRDLSDLVERLEWTRDNPAAAQAIGRAGQALALEKLTRDAAVLQLARTLERLAGENSEAGYVAADLRGPLEPVLERLGAFA
ncbi:MAG: glycosyl transferase family 90 [Solirubrobacteraceae bacterium]